MCFKIFCLSIIMHTFVAQQLNDCRDEHTAASKFRNNDNAEEKSSSPRGHDSKHEDKRGQDARVVRSQSREGSLDRDVRGGERAMMGPRGGKDSLSMRKNSSREDMSVESDDERRGQGGGGEQRRRRSKTHDDSSTGSNGSRGRGSRLPNTSDDHRKGGGSQSCPDASTSARMYSHISGEPDERVCFFLFLLSFYQSKTDSSTSPARLLHIILLQNHRGRLPPQPARGGRSSSRDVDDEDSGRGGGGGAGGDVHRDSFELEAYDLSKASLTLSRDERLQFSKENEMRRQYDDGEEPDEKESGGHGDNDDEADGSRAPAPAPPKRRKPAPPPGGPQPRWNSPSRDGDDEKLEESPVAASRGGAGDVRADNFDSMSLDPSSKRRGVSIDELISDPALTVNLDDDSDEEEKVDFKVLFFEHLQTSPCILMLPTLTSTDETHSFVLPFFYVHRAPDRRRSADTQATPRGGSMTERRVLSPDLLLPHQRSPPHPLALQLS